MASSNNLGTILTHGWPYFYSLLLLYIATSFSDVHRRDFLTFYSSAIMFAKWLFSLASQLNMSPHITTPTSSLPLSGIYDLMMTPYVPFVAIFVYNAAVWCWDNANKQRLGAAKKNDESGSNAPRTSSAVRNVIIAHNLVLAVYSIWTFIDFMPAVIESVQTQGFATAFCDTNWTLWNTKLLKHGYLFYLSKYYEFIDTFIILYKGKSPGRLQTFHHSGAVLIMWLGNYVQSAYLAFFVFENSIIHSLMYTYYTVTAMGFKPPGKQWLTRMQIMQFYVALTAGIAYLGLPQCQNSEQRVFVYLFIPYILELIRLFNAFARQTYGKPGPQLAEKTN